MHVCIYVYIQNRNKGSSQSRCAARRLGGTSPSEKPLRNGSCLTTGPSQHCARSPSKKPKEEEASLARETTLTLIQQDRSLLSHAHPPSALVQLWAIPLPLEQSTDKNRNRGVEVP